MIKEESRNTGWAIVLAWPQTYCKQTGAWYDIPLRLAGINKNYYYKAGHAAVVLINKANGTAVYFDFGRYHAPFGMGRVRSEDTDPDLHIRTKVELDSFGKLINLQPLLQELASKKACHGSGDLHAAIVPVNYENSFRKAVSLQEQSPLPYGPFQWGGTNCSRFVHSVIMAGLTSVLTKLKLAVPLTITPSPLSNVLASGKRYVVKVNQQSQIPHKCNLAGTLEQPARLGKIPPQSQWLSGEGAGSWYHLEYSRGKFRITRMDEEGNNEFSGYFKNVSGKDFRTDKAYRFSYLSTALKVKIFQEDDFFCFERLQD